MKVERKKEERWRKRNCKGIKEVREGRKKEG